jgi:predicted amidohydrolase
MAPRIAVAQTVPVAGDVAANMSAHLRLAERAAAAGAHVVVFPELSLTGYEIELAERLAFSASDHRLAPLAASATGHRMAIVAGAPVVLEGRLHIGAFVLEPGRPPRLYTKRRLGAFGRSAAVDGTVPPAEATVFHAADHDPPVRFGDCLGAVAVCADVGDPAHAARASARRADAYLGSMFVIPSEFEAEAARLSGIARRYGMVVALANFGGPSGGLSAAGRSSIWSGRGDLVARLPMGGEGVALASGGPPS